MADIVKFRCPKCQRDGEWTDGMSVAAGDERDEYWCQTCGEESPLEDCERIEIQTGECDIRLNMNYSGASPEPRPYEHVLSTEEVED